MCRRRVGFDRYSLLFHVSPELQKMAVNSAFASSGSLGFFVYDARYSNASRFTSPIAFAVGFFGAIMTRYDLFLPKTKPAEHVVSGNGG